MIFTGDEIMKVTVTAHSLENISPDGGWMNYWLLHSEADCRTPYCAVSGCPEPPDAGATVCGNGKIYVVPMCPKHNIPGMTVELYPHEPLAEYPENRIEK